MRIAICDDEPVMINNCRNMIDEIMEEYGFIGEFRSFHSGGDLLVNMKTTPLPFDLYILDIKMGPVDGIEVARHIRSTNLDAIIIFLTSYQERMPEAFDVQAFHYLLKPVSKEKLKSVFKKVFQYMEDKKILYYFKLGKNLYSVPYRHIYYFESDKRKIKIMTANDDYYYYDTISNIQKILGESTFTRTHVAYFINMEYVRSFDGKAVTLENGVHIPVSKRYVDSFNRNFMKFVNRRI